MRFLFQRTFCSAILALLPVCTFAIDAAVDKSTALTARAAKATIGVISHADFLPDRVEPQKGEKVGLPDVLARRIIEHLTNSGRFKIIDRTALRRVVQEQRFGRDIQKTYLDRTLDKAIDAMENVHGGAAVISPDNASPTGRVRVGVGTVGTVGALSDYNDLIKDFQDLGTAVGADYLVLGNLEKVARSTTETAVPYSTSGRKLSKNLVDSRLRLRVIAVESGTVAAATSIRSELSETLFEGKASNSDQFTSFDHLGRLAGSKILDAIFPARIVSLEPLVISRGTNEGVKKGDVYLIEREGKELQESDGTVIARLKNRIGQIEIVELQDTVAIARPVEGRAFLNGDLASLDIQASNVSPQVPTAAATPLTGRTSGAAVKSSGLPRVAIGLVKSGSTATTGIEAQKHIPIFTDTIISRLTQTKRFQLIDRQEVDQLLNEQLAQALAENRDMPSAMGTLKSADYLVYGSLASFGAEEKATRLPGSSRIFIQNIGYVEGNMRIVDARSGDIMESRKIAVKQAIDPSANASRNVTLLADAYAEQVVLLLMNAIYPIKVAHVGGDRTVYINRGDDGGLYVGEVLDAFKPGQAIIDPDTGVQLGVEETLVGQVELTEVEDARSKGDLLQGGILSPGDLLKRTPQNTGKRASAALHAQQSAAKRSGGVLPGGQSTGQSKISSEKATLAVGLLRVNPSARTTGFSMGHVKRMSDDMILKLANSNRFMLMERQEVDQILDEKVFEAVASGGDIQSRLRELEGADYLIHGEIANFYINVERKEIPYLDEIQVTARGVAEGMFRVVDVHSGKVIAADKVRINEKMKPSSDTTQMMGDLMDRFTTESVAVIVSRLYPIKVLGMAADGVVYLNRGDDAGLKMGTQFDVMRPGQELIDRDTGRSFGSAETKVASIEIIAVEQNRSRAQIVSGANAQSGDVLRKPQIVEKKPEPEVIQPAW